MPARVDSSASEPSFRPRITIQSGVAAWEPLFCIPGAGDNGAVFAAFAEAIGSQWPVFALQPRGLDVEFAPFSTVEEAATCFLQAIDEEHPSRGVHLVGHSFGGWVAFEVACRMRRERVLSLTLVDSDAPDNDARVRELTHASVLGRFVQALELSSGKSLHLEGATLASLSDAACLSSIHAQVVRVGLLSARSKPDVLQGPLRTFAAAMRAPYSPVQCTDLEARLVLVHNPLREAKENSLHQAQTLCIWRKFAPHLQVWYGPGDHFSILRSPHVQVLSQWWLC